ncbi:hypothetical protein CYL21_1528 [Plasmodium falciparum NF54]|uniref:Plasmodium RESA N-terminal domain-containing protein n=2 Tax=Plasmodium falciparum TaxID=5833 RepID=A0A143ZZX7_PLAF7|nr:Plasmodium exported protein (PHISTa-like), unknown function [Plasmodium falciparum 3D7]KAF4330443.1 hypothetical protein CYL21_1528 [Plasmodium falciparum NF54]PKC46206.1 hypothetical protein CK202_3301 [Plasmodium falciparum NF54]CZT62766.1 Plasmodium exported protein (PHISTa-like), unknown function [Plasmodium falciparum 3D7]|eukprot:XP_002808739.1 Plasmodium exported protein (PHISTa-like),unknown function [Plasmodium falciparum 3D7]
MEIFYNKNLKTYKYNLYSTDINVKRMKCGITCRSFIFMSLSLCVISLFYISLLNIHEGNIVPSTKNIEIISRNLCEIENGNNEKRQNIMNRLDQTNESSKNSNNNKQITLENKPYNDMSKNLTEKELYDILNSLEECPPKEDLINIWHHALRAGKGFDNVVNELKALIQKYLDNDFYNTCCCTKKELVYRSIWEKNCFEFYTDVAYELVKYSNGFFELINGKHTLDDILEYIYSFLEQFKILKKELYEKYKKILLKKMN